MFPFSSKIAAVIPLSLLFPTIALAQEAEPAPPVEEAPTDDAEEEETEPVEAADEVPEVPDDAPSEIVEADPEAQPEPEPAVEPAEVVAEEEAAPLEAPIVEEEPPAPSPLPLKIGTKTWSRFELRQNYDTLGVARARWPEGEATYFRARLTFETNPMPIGKDLTAHVYFAPQAAGQWGTSGLGGTIGGANLDIYEGYFQMTSSLLAVKAGRFALKYGDVLVIGDLDWHQAGRAFDGAHVSFTPGKAQVDLFVTQQAEGLTSGQDTPFLGGDEYFWGAYAQLGSAIAEGLALDFYALGKSFVARDVTVTDPADPTMTVTNHFNSATFVTIGARIKQKIGVFDYRAEAGVQVGKSPAGTDPLSKFAYQGDLELGVSPAKGLRISVNGAFASGDGDPTDDKDNAYDELYPTTHKWMGLMDVIGVRSNVASGNLKLSYALPTSTVLKVDGHIFARPEGIGAGDPGLAGFEVDTNVIQKFGEYASVRGLYGIFLPSEDMYGSKVAAHYVALQGGVNF